MEYVMAVSTGLPASPPESKPTDFPVSLNGMMLLLVSVAMFAVVTYHLLATREWTPVMVLIAWIALSACFLLAGVGVGLNYQSVLLKRTARIEDKLDELLLRR
jgi:hypothetical protein